MIVPVPQPEGLSVSDFTEFIYSAFVTSRFPPGNTSEPLLFENASPGARAAWKAAAETALRLAWKVQPNPVGPNAMYHQPGATE